MFYEERVIDEKLMFRTTPDGTWFEVSHETLTARLVEAEAREKALEHRLSLRPEGLGFDLSAYEKPRFGWFKPDGSFEELDHNLSLLDYRYEKARWVGGTHDMDLLRSVLSRRSPLGQKEDFGDRMREKGFAEVPSKHVMPTGTKSYRCSVCLRESNTWTDCTQEGCPHNGCSPA